MEYRKIKSAFAIETGCRYHPEQTFLSICMERSCSKRYELCCPQCSQEKHYNHNILSLSKFIETYNTEREKYLQELNTQTEKLFESYDIIEKDFDKVLDSIIQASELVKNSVKSFKVEYNYFKNEIHGVEEILANIKSNFINFDQLQNFLDGLLESSSYHCSFKDINKSYKFQSQAKQLLAYFTEQNAISNKIFGDKVKQEGMLLNLKSINGYADTLKKEARILLSSKQDFSFLNKQNGNHSYVDELDKIPIKELVTKKWNEIQNIIDQASNEVLYSLPQIDFTIGIYSLQNYIFSLIKTFFSKLFLICCQKQQIFLSKVIRKNKLYRF